MAVTETMKRQTSLENYLKDAFFRPEDQTAAGGLSAVRCYDKSWQELPADPHDIANGTYPQNVSFVLRADFRLGDQVGQPVLQSFSTAGAQQALADHTGRMCLLTVSVEAFGKNVEGRRTQKELVRYDASKYFPE